MTEATKKHHHHRQRYHVDQKRVLLEIKVKAAAQLFDARDPAPFLERDLDDDAVEYLVSSAEEFSLRTPMRIVIHVADGGDPSLDSEAIRESFHNYFDYQAELLRKKLSRVMKTGQVFLSIGIFFLVSCLFLAGLAGEFLSGTAGTIAHEGLVITGWVAMWRPLEIFLFDWYPLLEKRRYYMKLASTDISVKFAGSPSTTSGTPSGDTGHVKTVNS
jgi:hypothetical protein